jgi:acetolactate synthase-1/2/3 large subunit
MLSGSTLLGDGLIAAQALALSTRVRVFANRNAARMRYGRTQMAPQRVPYFPEPATELLKDLEHMILVESAAPVSFFGYPGQPSYLLPENCEVHVLASVEEDGTRALQDLVRECSAEPVPGAVNPEPLRLPAGEPLTPDSIGRAISALLPENAIVSDEMVSSGEPVFHHLLRAAPHDHLPVTGGSIGQGLPVALGAAIACPDRKVIALEADGSGMYTLQALWTMARERTDVVSVIFANRRYRILEIEMQRTGAKGFGRIADDMIDIGQPDLDWVKLSEGMGVEASRATTADEFIEQFGAAMRDRGPRLIEAVL